MAARCRRTGPAPPGRADHDRGSTQDPTVRRVVGAGPGAPATSRPVGQAGPGELYDRPLDLVPAARAPGGRRRRWRTGPLHGPLPTPIGWRNWLRHQTDREARPDDDSRRRCTNRRTTPPTAASSSVRVAPRRSSIYALPGRPADPGAHRRARGCGRPRHGGRLVRTALAQRPGQWPDRGALWCPLRPGTGCRSTRDDAATVTIDWETPRPPR